MELYLFKYEQNDSTRSYFAVDITGDMILHYSEIEKLLNNSHGHSITTDIPKDLVTIVMARYHPAHFIFKIDQEI